MVVFNVPIDKKLRIKLPKKMAINKSYFLKGGYNGLKIDRFDNDEYFILLKNRKYNDPFVIVLEPDIQNN